MGKDRLAVQGGKVAGCVRMVRAVLGAVQGSITFGHKKAPLGANLAGLVGVD